VLVALLVLHSQQAHKVLIPFLVQLHQLVVDLVRMAILVMAVTVVQVVALVVLTLTQVVQVQVVKVMLAVNQVEL